MKALPYILLIILAAGLLYMWLDKDSGHEREMLELKKQHYYAMDSLSKRAEMWRKAALEYGNEYRKTATKAMQLEQRFNYLREENNILKRRAAIRYSNSQLDSLLAARYDR